MDATDPQALDPATVAVTAGRGAGAAGDPLNHPLVLASVYRAGGRIDYAREGNPTWEAFEEVLGALEGGRACAFASGLAAVAAVLETLPVGARVVAPEDAYSGVRRLLADLAGRGRLSFKLVDVSDTDATLAACEGADLLWVETPTNPLLALADLAALAAGGHERGARVVADNTFATPLLQQPLDAGADAVVHSATKLIGGHSDLLLGATVTRDPRLGADLERRRVLHGAVPGPLEAWLALRGLRTLPVRLERAQASAAELAHRLAGHPAVTRTRYPGLPHHPGHERARVQMRGFGTMVAFEVAGGAAAADALCEATRVIVHATSLGGVETTMERRGRVEGEAHLPPGLVRLSVGCEELEDLWHDLEQALAAAGGA